MKQSLRRALFATGLALFAVGFGLHGFAGDARAENLQHGAFRIEEKGRRIGTIGLFAPTGRSTRTDVTEYRIRYRDGMVYFRDGRLSLNTSREADESFHDVRVVGASAIPALLVFHGGIHLLADRNGGLSAEALTGPVVGVEFFQWLDGEQGQPGSRRVRGLRGQDGESQRLEGGRYLLLGNRVVLDVKTLETFPYPGKIAEDTQPLGGYYLMQSNAAIALSPSASQYVAKLSADTSAGLPDALVLVNFRRGQHGIIPIDRRRTPFEQWANVDRAWIERHFVWATENGVEILHERR